MSEEGRKGQAEQGKEGKGERDDPNRKWQSNKREEDTMKKAQYEEPENEVQNGGVKENRRKMWDEKRLRKAAQNGNGWIETRDGEKAAKQITSHDGREERNTT